MENQACAKHFVPSSTMSSIDSELTKLVNVDQCSTAASVSERSTTSPLKPKQHPFYRNLVEEVRREKSEEKVRNREELAHDAEEDSHSNGKKAYHKSKSDIAKIRKSKEAQQLMASGSNLPVNMVINNVFQISGSERANYNGEGLIQTTGDMNSGDSGFVNRFKNPRESGDHSGKEMNKVQELPFKHLIFNKNSALSQKEFINHLKKVQKGLQYAKHHIKRPDMAKVVSKAVPLEVIPGGMKTLVLDLDGTLVHMTENKDEGHVTLNMKTNEGETKTFGIRFRPYLSYFLEQVSKKYEIIVFTAAQSCYASTVVDYIDPDRRFIKYVISRERCLMTKNGFFIKDLRILSNRDLNDIVIVDNLTHSFCLQLENGIPILDYQNDPNDKELKYLAKYLLQCAESPNIQEFNVKNLRLKELIDVDLSFISQKF